MIKKFQKQINNSFIYIIATVIPKAIPFLLLPVFTTYLTKEDYGTLGLISSILAIVSIYIGLRPSLFITVKMPQMQKDKFAIYIFNMFVLAVYLFLVVGVILIVVKHFYFPKIESYIFILIACLSFFLLFNDIVETVFQIERKALAYAIFRLTKIGLVMGLTLMLIIVYDLGWRGKYFADLFILFCFAIVALIYLKRQNYIVYKFDVMKQVELVKYLTPLTFHLLGLAMMGSIDRLFLANMEGLASTGVYMVSYTIGTTIGFVHDALLKVWSPEFYERIKNASTDMKIKILKFKYLYMLGSFLVYGIFLLLLPIIFSVMVDEKFQDGYEIIPIIALGFTFEAFRKLFIGYHYNLGKNGRIAMLTIVAGIINAVLNYFFIPLYGIMGAAYTTLLAYVVVFILTIVDLNKIEKINWSLRE
jgi:O-antigen/teichoic acid export membrane protein